MAWTPEQDDRLRELAAEGMSVRKIGETVGKGKSAVAHRLRFLGVGLDRSNVEAAAEASRTLNKHRRAMLSARMLEEAEHALDRIHDPYVFVASTKDGIETRELDEPDAGAHRNLMTTAGIAVDKHLAIERVDSDGGQAAAVSVLERMVTGLGLPRTAADAPDPDDVVEPDLEDADADD